ncbi:methyl-accepting chemotaxis protein [Actinoplanes friuliensis]|uniref:Methyl-accepting chemotaxis aspartate transducer n=1 Tax=Actinoplanes friuliensis DSM 7358 TaxID=1246995 RepID=U5VSM2_9ACTN|nr:methyl-accepting chemotaxis protein [Actinoplanes friuliensis]AGZ39988.1 Methyl-accepting chemotaxis aspartate transducer [Actinoplanes friuliensis DSM 7358]
MSLTSAAPPALLRPVLPLADRMRTSMRLGVLILVLMIPGIVATCGYVLQARSKIAFSAAERDGLEVVRPALLAMASTVAAKEPDLAAVRDAVGRNPELRLEDSLRAVPQGLPSTPVQRFALATALAGLITDAGNNSNLILDPDLDSFYVMDAQIVQLPKALLAAAKIAAAEVTSGNSAVAEQAVRAGELAGAASSLTYDVDTADANTKLAGLAARLEPVGRAADAASGLAAQLTRSLERPGPADVGPLATALAAAVGPLVEVLDDLLEIRVTGFANERLIVLLVTIGGFVLAAWFAAGVLWRTRHDVALAVQGVTAIADGDLEPRPLPAGRDELGDLGQALTSTRSRILAQEEEIAKSQAVREEQLRVSFQHQRQAEMRLRDRAQTIIDESTSVIAEELRLVTSQVGDVREAADTIDSGISATDAATEAVVAHARRAENVITSLEQSLRRVADTATLVKGIAGQTRLLALNATIEAARAGELGLGFTVVADEVKELATSTSTSTEQIAATIAELERDTAQMAATIAEMVSGIAGVGEAATSLRAVAADQGTVVGRLADQMGQTIGRVEEMSGLSAQLERREADRVTVTGSIRVRRGNEVLTPTLINLSRGGVRVQLQPGTRLNVGDAVEIDDLGPAGDPIRVQARVVSLGTGEEHDEAGLQFMIADNGTAERVDRYVSNLVADASVEVS